jgi:ribosomal-protein-alanine N-acetyltransferase
VKAELVALGPDHLEACVALDQRCLSGLWTPDQWATELADPARPGLGLLEGDALWALACGWLIVDELHITAVAVDPRRRRLGLGRQMLETLLLQGRALGAERATLEVASSNRAARGLYAALGFREAGIRRGYYRNGDDALIQWRTLSGQERSGTTPPHRDAEPPPEQAPEECG